MDTRSSSLWMIAAFFLVTVFPPVVYSDMVRTYGGSYFNLPIPAESGGTKGWMADAVVEVPDHFIITDLDIRISAVHTNVFDLQVFLRSPSGKLICLNQYDFDEFFIDANYTDTIFDDEASSYIKEGDAPFTDRFRPLEPYTLSKFDGEEAFGPWRLQIYDAWEWDSGTLKCFELMITAPEPTAAIFLTFGAALLRFFKTRRSPSHSLTALF